MSLQTSHAVRLAPIAVGAPAQPDREREPFRSFRMFGIEVADCRIEQAARWIVQRARLQLDTNVAFLNAHCVNVMHANAHYRGALGAMDRIFADGIGVRIAARVSQVELRDNVNGTDLFPILCREAAAVGIGLYLLGGRDGIAERAGAQMTTRNPGLVIAGTHHGYLADPAAEAAAIASINASGAGILLVGLGVPEQELWIARNRHRLEPAVIIAVGGLFDYYSGRIHRAPLLLRKAGLEWAWRLALEPRRLARRYVIGNAEFLARLAWQRIVAPADFRQRSPTQV